MQTLELNIRTYFIDELIAVYDRQEAASIAKIAFEEVGIGNSFQEISREQERKMQRILAELKTGKPIQYVLGKAWFYNLILQVDPSVLIPRQETEELVNWIIKDFKGNARHIADFGTGSACIPLALKKNLPATEVYGYDISPAALETAKKNAGNLLLNVNFQLFDILKDKFTELPEFDIIVSNPPYVTLREGLKMHKNVMEHEPHLALFVPDENPLIFYRKIAELGRAKLLPGGKIYLEINEAFGKEIKELYSKMGYTNIILRKDLNGKDRMIRAELI